MLLTAPTCSIPGATNWTLGVAAPGGGNTAPGGLTTGMPTGPQPTNSLDLAVFNLGGQLYAIDSRTGQLAWTHTPYNGSQPVVTGWSDAASSTLYLTSSFQDTTSVVPMMTNVVEALDPATGALLWRNTTAKPAPSGLPQSNTATTSGVTALPRLAAYAKGPRVAAMSAATGFEAWHFDVGGSGFGAASANANITSVVYVEPGSNNPAGSVGSVSTSSILANGSSSVSNRTGALLLANSVFQQVRFLRFNLNSSLSLPPSLAWQMSSTNDFEGTLRDDLVWSGLQTPVVSGESMGGLEVVLMPRAAAALLALRIPGPCTYTSCWRSTCPSSPATRPPPPHLLCPLCPTN